MTEICIASWCAWANEVRDEEAWRIWARDPRRLLTGGVPEVPFVPPLQRRRCDDLARMMLYVSHGCCDAESLATLPVVFASRHGPIDTTARLLADLAAAQPLSPTRFSHSVHNTQVGLFSMWSGNSQAASAISARENTFAEAFVETLALMHRSRHDDALLVIGDVALPDAFEEVGEAAGGGYAVALRLARRSGRPLRFEISAATQDDSTREWPDALEFVRWMASVEPTLRIVRGGRSWTWRRLER